MDLTSWLRLGNTYIYLYVDRVVILVSPVEWMGWMDIDREMLRNVKLFETNFTQFSPVQMPRPTSLVCRWRKWASG